VPICAADQAPSESWLAPGLSGCRGFAHAGRDGQQGMSVPMGRVLFWDRRDCPTLHRSRRSWSEAVSAPPCWKTGLSNDAPAPALHISAYISDGVGPRKMAPWPSIEPFSEMIQSGLIVNTEFAVLVEILSKSAVRNLVRAPLPWAAASQKYTRQPVLRSMRRGPPSLGRVPSVLHMPSSI